MMFSACLIAHVSFKVYRGFISFVFFYLSSQSAQKKIISCIKNELKQANNAQYKCNAEIRNVILNHGSQLARHHTDIVRSLDRFYVQLEDVTSSLDALTKIVKSGLKVTSDRSPPRDRNSSRQRVTFQDATRRGASAAPEPRTLTGRKSVQR